MRKAYLTTFTSPSLLLELNEDRRNLRLCHCEEQQREGHAERVGEGRA